MPKSRAEKALGSSNWRMQYLGIICPVGTVGTVRVGEAVQKVQKVQNRTVTVGKYSTASYLLRLRDTPYLASDPSYCCVGTSSLPPMRPQMMMIAIAQSFCWKTAPLAPSGPSRYQEVWGMNGMAMKQANNVHSSWVQGGGVLGIDCRSDCTW